MYGVTFAFTAAAASAAAAAVITLPFSLGSKVEATLAATSFLL